MSDYLLKLQAVSSSRIQLKAVDSVDGFCSIFCIIMQYKKVTGTIPVFLVLVIVILSVFVVVVVVVVVVIIISNGNRTEWSPTQSVIIRVITKSDDRPAGVRFVYHEYDYRLNWTRRSPIINES